MRPDCPRLLTVAFAFLGLILLCASQTQAQLSVRQVVSAETPNQGCTEFVGGDPFTCTPGIPSSLTINFAPISPGSIVIAWASNFQCIDNLGQQWVTDNVGFQTPPTGGQVAGITSLTCTGWATPTTGPYIIGIEMSGVLPTGSTPGGGTLTSGVPGTCGTLDPNSVGILIGNAFAGDPWQNPDPGAPAAAQFSSNFTAGATASELSSLYSPNGTTGPPFYDYEYYASLLSYAIAGSQAVQSTMTITNPNNQGNNQSCTLYEFREDFSKLSDPGPCSDCELIAGQPINLATGDVWISAADYSVPGLNHGLSLIRTWNSLWAQNQPPFSAGMFGTGWTSDFEERLQTLDNSHIRYWLSSGNAWVFQNTCSGCAYSVVSPLTEHASLVYSSSTSLYTLTFANGTSKTFNSTGYLTALIDRNGNKTTLTYDTSNRITNVTAPGGQSLTFSYGLSSDPGRATSMQDSVGNVANYSYSNSQLTQATYPDGGQLNYAYDANGNISSVTDALGKVVETHSYNSSGRGLTSSRANGVDLVTVQYPSTGTTTITDSNSNATTYSSTNIAGRGFITGIQGPGCDSCGGRNNYSYTLDASGNRLSTTDPNNNTTTFTYDSNSNVLTQSIVVNGSTLTSTYTYNSFQEVLTAGDPLGFVTTNTYDAKGNLLTTTTPSPDGGTTAGSQNKFTYDSKGELLTLTDPLGNGSTLTYYSTGLLNTIKDAQRNVTTFAYDGRGNRASVKDALNNATTFTYDSMNRLTKITYPTSPTTSVQMAYDKRGRRISATDADNKTTAFAYDDADRLTSVTDPANGITQYGYDTENNLTSITDASNHVTAFTYQLGRLTSTLFPSNISESYTYDPNGNLGSKTDRNGNTINYSYDHANRLTQKSYPNSTAVSYTYDANSRLTQVTDPTGTYQLTYDNMGRLKTTITNYSFLTGKTFTNTYSYDAASNRTGYTDPENGATTYSYDSLDRLSSLAPPTAIGGGSFGFGYDALSRRTSMTRPNSVTTSYAYDTLSRLLSVLHKKKTTTLDGAVYTLDNAGNRLTRAPQPNGTASSFTYDPLSQLTAVQQGTATTESYSYDAVGNRQTSLGVPSYIYNNSNELTSSSLATFTYDNNGSTLTKATSNGTTTYTWDYENRLSSVTLPGSGGTVNLKYDPFGRRIYKSSSSGTSIFAYDGDDLVEETNASATVVARYAQSLSLDEPLALLRAGATSYYDADGLGSITSIANSSGAVIATYTFDSFGNQVASTGSLSNAFRYTARESDSETGLYYSRARYYDPTSGRFLSEDPLGLSGGPNIYVYANNNSPLYLDPFGLAPGTKYRGLDCAGLHAIRDINTTSRRRNLEYAGKMYKYHDGTYSYTKPVQGGAAGVDFNTFTSIRIPRGATLVGWYHTHAAFDPDLNDADNGAPGTPDYNWKIDGNEIFSGRGGDKAVSDSLRVPGYLGTPRGTLEKYKPRPGHPLAGPVSVMGQSPCDVNCQ